jgi:CspA family cold shock protein
MRQGKIIFFNKKTQFGFIKGTDNKDYYIRGKNLIDDVIAGDHVEFEIKDTKKGPEAIAVKKLSVN